MCNLKTIYEVKSWGKLFIYILTKKETRQIKSLYSLSFYFYYCLSNNTVIVFDRLGLP